jgi:iron complex transport system ATP-binding protein
MMQEKSEPFLLLEHVSVARGDNVVLHDINLRIQPGEHVAILGPNGCGKSTLIKTMTCECYPLAVPGMRVRIFGRERWDLTELKKRLGVVSPELPGRQTRTTTGFDAVVSGFFSSSTLWPNLVVTLDMKARAWAVMAQLDATHLAEKPVGEMSAGEQRRTMIGRALVQSSEMLLLDEPSNALDIAAQRELRQLLRKLAGEGVGILLVTHLLADIPPEIERVIMLKDGRIFADGAKEDLMTRRRLRDLFGVDLELTRENGFYHIR